MRKGFYSKLALSNIKNHRRLYVPYILSCVGTIAMFYIMLFLSGHSALRAESATGVVLGLGSIVIGIFAVIIVLYANSFLMKRRNKELGLYNILGMEKKHIARIMATETLYAGFGSIIVGVGLGILLSKLMLLLICSLLKFEVPYGFEISYSGILASVLLFSGIFLIALIYNVSRVGFTKPIELLKGSNMGEREPKTKWLMVAGGIVTLGAGYALAVTTKIPSMAIVVFFIAVILVIIGTYCLFTAGSIALLKALRKNKRYYYKTRHFTAISGMIYRMKQNAAGLATICILSTMVLVMLSTTICLYSGMEDAVRGTAFRDVIMQMHEIDDGAAASLASDFEQAANSAGVPVEDRIMYRYADAWASTEDGVRFTRVEEGQSSGKRLEAFRFIPLRDYNSLFGLNETLEADEVLICTDSAEHGGSIMFGDHEYSIKGDFAEFPFRQEWDMGDTAETVLVVQSTEEFKNILPAVLAEDFPYTGYTLCYGVDTDTDEHEYVLYQALDSVIDQYAAGLPEGSPISTSTVCAADTRKDFVSIYGSLFFLGIFLGLMFTCACVLIMYYKQVSEGYDDRARFEIMQNVGMSLAEVKASIRSQVLTVFFLPLIAAGIHVAFAFPLIATLFVTLKLTNTTLFLWCTLACYAVFTLFYVVVYALTARTYYKIVK